MQNSYSPKKNETTLSTIIESNIEEDDELVSLKLQIHELKLELKKLKSPTNLVDNRIPEIAIIVPYRDRVSQKSAFMKIMPVILKNLNYKIFFIHQRDRRPFNRGAIKNLGFLYIKGKYPHNYKNINLVFHDIDIMPWREKQFSYKTTFNVVNHFYGFEHALGGILAIKGRDFERINGYPNIWTWGLEDNTLQMRCIKNRIGINRSEFVNLHEDNKNIISLWHGWDRLISPNIEPKWRYDKGNDGIVSLFNINIKESKIDNNFFEINVYTFETGESLNSPFVRNAKKLNARNHVRQNQPMDLRQNKITNFHKRSMSLKNMMRYT